MHYQLIETVMKTNVVLLSGILLWGCSKKEEKDGFMKIPLVVITDLYHPHQDPGDNLDLINGFAMPDVDLRAVILDITMLSERTRPIIRGSGATRMVRVRQALSR